MAEDLTIKAAIEILLKGKGPKEAVQALETLERQVKKAKVAAQDASKETSKQARETEKLGTESKKTAQEQGRLDRASSKLQKTFRNLLGTAVAFFGAFQAVRFIRDSIVVWADLERQYAAVGRQVEALGMSQREGRQQARAFTRALAEQTDILVRDSLPVFNKFIGILGSVEGAQFATKLAADLTNAGLGDLRTNGERLANLLQGEVTEAAKSLGLTLRDENGVIKTQEQLLKELTERWFGFSEAQDDARTAIDSTTVQIERMQAVLGERLEPAVLLVSKAIDGLVKFFQSLGPLATQSFFEAARNVETFGKVVAAALDFGTITRDGIAAYNQNVREAFREGRKSYTAEIEATQDEIAAIWLDSGKLSAEAFDKGLKDALELAAAKRRERELKEQERLRKQREDEAKQIAEERARLEAEAEQRLLAERIRIAMDGTAERLRLELQMLDMLEREAIAKAKAVGASTLAIEKQFMLARDELRREFEEDQAAKEEINVGRIAGITYKSIEEVIKAEEAAAKKRAETDRRLAEQKIELAQTVAVEAIYAAQAIFGESKALNIALAIANTWAGVTQALKAYPPPTSFIMAALVAAQGFAAVRNIQNTQIGGGGGAGAPGGGGGASVGDVARTTGTTGGIQAGGFDDPINDMLARRAGQRWADDLLREIGMGMFGRLEETVLQPASPVTNDYRTLTTDNRETYNLNIKGLTILGKRSDLKTGVREITREQRRDLSRKLR